MSSLHELAAAYGVDAEVWSWQGEHQAVADATLRAVLSALGADASTEESCAAELDRRRSAHEGRTLPPYVVARDGEQIRVPTRAGTVELRHEDGTVARLDAEDGHVTLPDGLAIGYHLLRTAEAECTVIRPPRRVPLPSRLERGSAWGLAAQLYSVRSAASWGVGDLGDLRVLADWAAAEGADFVLVNPLHAAEVAPPMEPSPYSPVTRRFGNPLYLRIADIAEYAELSPTARAEVDRLGTALDNRADPIDRDASWAAKRAALEHLYAQPTTDARAAAFVEYRDREGGPLADFARWCVNSEGRGDDPDRVRFWAWTQWLLDEQLAAVQQAALGAGMGLGIVHDVAVGVSPTGSDAQMRAHELATSMTVGAPPDAYSQTGQDWNQPPWRPDRLAELGYAPFRDLFAAALRHSGGLRVDHVIGLFRLWWIPRGRPALEGTYVRYDHDAAIGILMIEATRAGAVLIGEDLGNVEPWVRDYLGERGIFGTSILWFEYDSDGGDKPLTPDHWRRLCLASVTTHDLPPTLGYLAGDHVRLRHELGLLTRDYDDELAADRTEQARWLDVLRNAGLLGSGDEPEQVVLALHELLGRAPSLLRCAALTDAVGDRRIQNQPATTQAQHPNWRIPLSGPDGRALLFDEVVADGRADALLSIMRRVARKRPEQT